MSNKIISINLVLVFALLSFSCQKQTAPQPTTQPINAQTPTDAYKMLYAAVKGKDAEKIKQMVSKSTQGLAEFMAAQYKQPIEKSYENGFTATTFADSLPEIRDERVKDNFGAIEVFNQGKNAWEDLPFIKEDGGWKLAIGDAFNGTYKSPGKGKSQIEQEATNTTVNNAVPMITNTNGNLSSNSKSKSIEVPPENKPKK
ncbi:MAG: hypothetical protein LC768_14645 [Acidobacteria bacterium]|nr:hypothetical protein [Acidobacteriota bacterium]MCA1639545.1 hypothetical protein [Acidobacteriota bacterium]